MFSHQHMETREKKKKKNKKTHLTIRYLLINFDEDTGEMEGQGEGAEERKELTGTSFQYQRVGHCQKRRRDRKEKKTRKWKTGAQGEVLSLEPKNEIN